MMQELIVGAFFMVWHCLAMYGLCCLLWPWLERDDKRNHDIGSGVIK